MNCYVRGVEVVGEGGGERNGIEAAVYTIRLLCALDDDGGGVGM